MAKIKSYQTILISSIVLVIVFVSTLVFSVQTSQRHSHHVNEMNAIFLSQSVLGDLSSNFERYIVEVDKNLRAKSNGGKRLWKEFYLKMNEKLEALNQIVSDAEVRLYLSDLALLSERLKRYENSILEGNTIDGSELYVYQKKFYVLKNNIAQHLVERYTYHKDANSRLLKQGRVASVFIVVFGAAVALALAVSVYTALRQTVSRNYVQTIMQTVGTALVVVNEEGRIIFINEKMKKMFGFDLSKDKKVYIKDLVESKLYDEYIKPNRSFELEIQFKSNTCEWIPVLASGTILRDETGAYQGFLISAQDLRASKAMQKQLTHAEKMVSLGTIAAGVAHEINNPISFIQSNLSTLKDYYGRVTEVLNLYEVLSKSAKKNDHQYLLQELESIDQKKKEKDFVFLLSDIGQALNDSLEGTDRIKEIVQGLRSFSRNDESVLGFVDLNEVLEGTLKLVWNELKYKCEVKKDFDTLPLLRCYPRQLSQVFMNLLLNASQSIIEHGKVTVKTEANSEGIIVTIADTGKGMSKEVLSKIFDPFFTTKAVGAGTGLGLSISYGIIKKHGGVIEVESEEGKGSTFKVILPFEGEKGV